MRERFVERKLVSEVKKRGGICPKWVSPSFSGVPDRLVFLPKGKFGLVEVK
ncbi:TPA: VRR-NUC domain-containing protein, partial [Streptococcus suis]